MAKYKTLELHLVELKTLRISAGSYRHTLTLRDWDDGEQIKMDINLSYPINAVTPIKFRVLVEDLPESPPEE